MTTKKAPKLKRRKANNKPVAWSAAEERELLARLRKNGHSVKTLLPLFPSRSYVSLRNKARKLRIKHNLFGQSYRNEKQHFTSEICATTTVGTVFDAYAGAGAQTFTWIQTAPTVFAAEVLKTQQVAFLHQAAILGFKRSKYRGDWILLRKGGKRIFFYQGDAVDAAAEIRANRQVIDLVDLDTCGSTLPTLPIFLALLNPKHLVITHGEFHSLRFKRDDVLRRILTHRDIRKSALPMTADRLREELDRAVKLAALRSLNETRESHWLELKKEAWLGHRAQGMLRRYYAVSHPAATADCINVIT